MLRLTDEFFEWKEKTCPELLITMESNIDSFTKKLVMTDEKRSRYVKENVPEVQIVSLDDKKLIEFLKTTVIKMRKRYYSMTYPERVMSKLLI